MNKDISAFILIYITSGAKALLTSITPATQEAKIRRVIACGQPKQNMSENPLSINELGMVEQTCNVSNAGGHS
jgi:hypothetical protein